MSSPQTRLKSNKITEKRSLFAQLNILLNRRERRNAMVLLLLMITQAGAELVGVVSIAPFMGVVADASLIHNNVMLSKLYEMGGFTSDTDFLTALGIGVILTLTITNTLVAFTTWAMNRFVWGMHHKLSVRMLRGYLAQPYSFFTQRNTATLNQNILSEIEIAVERVLLPALLAVSRTLVTLTIVGLLVFLDPLLAVTVVIVLGGAYGVVFLTIKRNQRRLGRIRADANGLRYKLAGEAFGGIKDVKVLQREADFVRRFIKPSWQFSYATASNRTMAVIPRYLLETIAFSSVLLIIIYYLQAGHGIATILPTISLYAFAGLRLMPALQQIFNTVTTIRFNRPMLDDLIADLEKFDDVGVKHLEQRSVISTKDTEQSIINHRERHPVALSLLKQQIQLDNVSFRYSDSNKLVLSHVSISIPKNQTIGLVGASGAGKTTLVDLLLGLFMPDEGQILIDNTPLTATNLPGWRRQVGYVPQHIFLTDDSVTSNIAFGVPPELINSEWVEKAARISHLHSFIQTLPKGYETIVGERGVRLSGGQRQRIGIARALYHDPSVLIMDEATSALDGETEDAVMEAIKKLSGQKTIILIAHRLTTIEECDCIYLFETGQLLAQGTYEELAARSAEFRTMARMDVA